MSDGLFNGLLIIPILAVLILVHEIGHFVAARSVGVTVEEFGIGIPPRLKGWTRNGVIWSINWIPFGGFVRVKGEDASDADPGSMNTKGPLQRAFFLVAGSTMNFLLAILLLIGLSFAEGETDDNFYITTVQAGSAAEAAGWEAGDRIVEVAGSPISRDRELAARTEEFEGREMGFVLERDGVAFETTVVPNPDPPANMGKIGIEFRPWPEASVLINAVAAGSAAEAAGLQAGDRFVMAGGREVLDAYALGVSLRRGAGGPVPVTFERDGQRQEVQVAVPAIAAEDRPLDALGVAAEVQTHRRGGSLASAIPEGFTRFWLVVTATADGIRQIFTGDVPLSSLTGPVGMGQALSEVTEIQTAPLWSTVTTWMVLISVNLGLLNLLPLPALDGGRLLFVIIEVLRGGRRVAPEREGLVHMAGFVLLIGLMLIITFADIGRLVSGENLLPR